MPAFTVTLSANGDGSALGASVEVGVNKKNTREEQFRKPTL
jgi:hypothetical protein